MLTKSWIIACSKFLSFPAPISPHPRSDPDPDPDPVQKNRRRKKGSGPTTSTPSSTSTSATSGNACAICGDFVRPDQRATAGDLLLHKGCLRCAECRRDLTSTKSDKKSFFNHGGKPYCSPCYERSVAPRCAGCGDPCLGDKSGNGNVRESNKTIEAMHLHWHARCFRCYDCGRSIQGLFQERMGRPVCSACSRRR